ncbi:MAG: hypothetical protein IT379_05560, partial [Deltaproteobacteria bacterium]|nr:hypothetical protein [Deltaproteobacteria bacterium]
MAHAYSLQMAPAARIWVAIVGSTALMATSIGCGDDDVGPRAAEDSGIVDAPAADSGADDDAAVDGG